MQLDEEQQRPKSAELGVTTSIERLSDEQLVEFLKLGHMEAMEPIYRRYSQLFTRIACDILKNPTEAEDVVQDTFVKAYRKIEQYDCSRATPKVWLMQLLYSQSLQRRKYLALRHYYTNQQIGRESESGDDSGPEPHHWPDPVESLTFEERNRIIREGIAKLPAKQKQAIELVCYESMEMRDAAHKMEDSYDNVRHHYYRGLKRLRQVVLEMLAGQAVCEADCMK